MRRKPRGSRRIPFDNESCLPSNIVTTQDKVESLKARLYLAGAESCLVVTERGKSRQPYSKTFSTEWRYWWGGTDVYVSPKSQRIRGECEGKRNNSLM